MTAYFAAYAEAYGWLFDHCPPWRWLLSAALIPGSPVRRTLDSVEERVA